MTDNKIVLKNEDRLLKILSMINDWLKFAETKNAMLIAFNGASIYGLAKALELSYFKMHIEFAVYFVVVIVILAFSVVVGLLSFIPQLSFFNLNKRTDQGNTSNIFFGHLKNKSETEIIQGICETTETKFSHFEIDIAHQIQQNSIIASNKFDLFRIAVWITIVAYVHVLAFLFWIILTANKKQQSR